VLFGSTEVAERIERVETQLITAATEAASRRVGADAFVIPIAGGAACYAEDGSPMNKVVGLGFGGEPSSDALDQIEEAFAGARGRYAGRTDQPRGSRDRRGLDGPGLSTGVFRECPWPLPAG
jgi:hypothetical protein